MTITIGINANHADSAISIFEKNKLIFALEEERVNRIKHWAGVPFLSLKYGLEFCNIDFSDIDNIAINTNPFSNLDKKIPYFIKNYLLGHKKHEIFLRQKKKLNLKKVISNNFPSTNKFNLQYIDHHISHLASAFYPSNFDNALGLSIDGFGDFVSVAIAECKNNKIKIIDKISFPNSLGLFYEAMTQLIGFKKYGEEYKMMGLSSYGKPRYTEILQKILFSDIKKIKLNLKYFNHHKSNFIYNYSGEPKQNKIFNNIIYNEIKINEEDLLKNEEIKKDLAKSAQDIYEKVLDHIVNKAKKLVPNNRLIFAGGCALNSLANKSLFENKFDDIYIPYAPGDSGGAIGASLYFLSNKYKSFENLQNPYLGPNYSNNYIEKILKEEKLFEKFNIKFYENDENLLKDISFKLSEDKIIGFFNDKMEFGARALGNRSILANPCSNNMKEILNIKIKRRENFRPFAPAIIYEKKNFWFQTNTKNPYMSNVENILIEKRKLIPAVTHIDGTGRVQSVHKETNLRFYKLIEFFEKITNVPILLNTSFNENEPIVMTPEHAINCFVRTKMDYLVLNNFLISRN